MGDVEIVRLRVSRRNLGAQRILRILLAPRDKVEIIADTDDLHRTVESCSEVDHDSRRELDGPLLARDVRRLGVANEPIVAAIDPDIHAMIENKLDRALGRVGGEESALR
jgi:hypothetical protein